MIIGIDTGISGGMALLDSNKLVDCRSTPTYWKDVAGKTKAGNKKRRRKIDYLELMEILAGWHKQGANDIIIESVHSLPRDSATAAFSFGEAFGCFTAMGHGLGFTVHHVSPQKWKKALNLEGVDKNGSLDRARCSFGDEFFKFKKDHNKAEAALIAAYGLTVIGSSPK